MEMLKKELLKEEKKLKKEFTEKLNQNFKERNINKSFEYLAKSYLTELKYQKYLDKTLTATEVKKIILQKGLIQIEKDTKKELEELERVANAENVKSIIINVKWKKSATLGANPTATITIFSENSCYTTEEKASGGGYDKESAAIAEALNKSDDILKELYNYKEKQLKKGKKDYSKTACSGHDNRDIIAYGAGYSILPYFEGGVGMSCFETIFNLLGFKLFQHHAKNYDFYKFDKI